MGWKSITGIISVVGGIAAFLLGWEAIKEKIIYHFLDDYHEQKIEKKKAIIIGPIMYANEPGNLYYIDTDRKKYAATRIEGIWYVWDNSIAGNDKWRLVD